MPKIEYISKKFRQDTLDLIGIANNIISDYQSRGYDLTLRQLYYQLVARDLIPNSERSYKKLGSTIANARDAGLVDWHAIVDRTRSREGLTTWDNPGQIIKAAYQSFRTDKWNNQLYHPFVWVEKEALAGVIQRACEAEDIQVDYLPCRGYMSASTIWREAQNIVRLCDLGKIPVIIHLGDHDPSGIDMTRDNMDRLELYSGVKCYTEGSLHNSIEDKFILKRLALNMDQVEEYGPPPNPAKLTDTRASDYVDKYGSQSWELDALDPDVLVDMIQETIDLYKDDSKWAENVEIENEYKITLKYISENWQRLK